MDNRLKVVHLTFDRFEIYKAITRCSYICYWNAPVLLDKSEKHNMKYQTQKQNIRFKHFESRDIAICSV